MKKGFIHPGFGIIVLYNLDMYVESVRTCPTFDKLCTPTNLQAQELRKAGKLLKGALDGQAYSFGLPSFVWRA